MLMGRYCDGDRAGFHALYSAVAPRLLGFLIGLSGERALAEDLLQHTFLKLHEARPSYVRGADPLPWIYTIAHRTFLDDVRRKKRAKVTLTDDGAVPDAPAEPAGPEPEWPEMMGKPDAGFTDDTLAALARLPENQREALILTKVHGRSMAEAAAITGSTPGAVKLRAHRAYVTLRKLLGARRE